jgi:acetolactate synthase I/III small subunit
MKTTTEMKRRALLVFMLNRPGVLNKISSLIRRKMYNVGTITACPTLLPGITRMTLTLREDSDEKVMQVIRQLEKQTEIISARELDTEQSFWREVGIVKLEADGARLDALSKAFNLEILDHQNHEIYIVQIAGTSKFIDDFLQEIGRDKILEVARTGFTAMEK